LMAETGADKLTMAEFGVEPSDFGRVADITVDGTGIDWDRYVMSKADLIAILEQSYTQA